MKLLSSLFVLANVLCTTLPCLAQEYRAPDGGDVRLASPTEPCIAEQSHDLIRRELFKMKDDYLREHPGWLRSREDTTFSWPIRQSDEYAYDYVYGISNFVDQNPAFPGEVTDFNCTSRSYDTQGGYNHPGTDMFVWPFHWRAVKYDQVEVIAPASGVILSIQDGNRDTNCDFNDNSAIWNAIYLLHDNGFVTWYGHLKAGSFTEKSAGERVERGEFLGIMASSGRSSGPHLHFEIYDDEGRLIDPYSGPCNTLNSTTYWDEQKPYREPRINALITHSARPQFSNCVPVSGEENTLIKSCFAPGESVITTAYYHDQRQGDTTYFRLINPAGGVFDSWFHVSPSTYNASWWFWTYNAPQNAISGQYTWEARFGDQVTRTHFYIGETEKNIADTTLVCEGSKATLTAPQVAGAQYFWSNGMRIGSVDLAHTGTYTVSVTSSNSCREVTFPVTGKPAPDIDLPTRLEFCPGESVELSAPAGYNSYQWSTGETSPSITIADEGRYILDLSDASCTYQFSVDAFPRKIKVPDLIAGPDQASVTDTAWYTVDALPDHTYDWSLNGGRLLSAGRGDSIQVVWEDGGSVGDICVITTDPTGCVSDNQACLRVEIAPLTATRDIPGLRHCKVFPNPAGEQLHITFTTEYTSNLQVRLVSPLGQEVGYWQWELPAGQQERSLDLRQVPDGWYILTIEHERGIISQPVVHRTP